MWPFSKIHTHNWKKIDKRPIRAYFSSIFGKFNDDGVLIVQKCVECKEYSAYIKFLDGRTQNIDIDYLEAVLNYKLPTEEDL